ncbi:MAG: ribonuclease E/G [Kiloniellales bacterium]
MPKQMLIDATHPEETRVVVLSDKRLEEFDYETLAKKQLKGNIYLAKVTRVEPSLQAAFVDYGGNRHGFLPFSEIHPDYYRIPIADREALLAEEAAIGSAAVEEEAAAVDEDAEDAADNGDRPAAKDGDSEVSEAEPAKDEAGDAPKPRGRGRRRRSAAVRAKSKSTSEEPNGEVVEVEVETGVDTVGGDEADEDARKRARLLRRYKIQEVIKRRQVLLVQVTKEERGNKGAALTTYLSLAGRYCVLMPNTNKGGGISRKIASATDRRRLKGIISDLDIPEGMAVIVRTAGSQRSKAEIRRDYDYLLRLWNEIRESTLRSTAPALIYEEANLIKRAIRDLYSRDMKDILVEGEEGYKAAKDFMKSLMPSHARKVQIFKDDAVPLFQRYQVEKQLDTMHSMVVQLSSGGYVVINPTEALVAIDVNSGRATKERHIEETALRTNLEAASEIARQLRLRDLAGLIVIDFIDMEESRHNREVERRLKEAMRSDRARIQLGRISPFGLLELSRQRLRPSLLESSTVTCVHCGGSGRIRSTESSALQVLRTLEEEGVRRAGGRLMVTVPTAIAFFVLNQKRQRLLEIEQRYGFQIEVEHSDTLIPPNFEIKRFADETVREAAAPEAAAAEEAPAAAPGGAREEERKRRRRRRGRRRDEEAPVAAEAEEAPEEEEAAEVAAAEESGEDEQQRPRRRRGKRGGRRRSRRRRELAETDEAAGTETSGAEASAAEPVVAETGDERPEASPEAPGEDDELQAEPADETTEDAGQASKPKPRRPRSSRSDRPRRSATGRSNGAISAAPPAEEPPDQAEMPAGPAESPAEVEALPLAAQPLAAAPEAAAEISVPEITRSTADAASSEGDKPKRRGWWNRLI